jgi:hypothetical protein
MNMAATLLKRRPAGAKTRGGNSSARTAARGTKAKKRVYFFGNGKAEGGAQMKDLLGGKGANLAEMSAIGIPVPPGFTITTEVCEAYYDHGRKLPEEVRPQVEEALQNLDLR